MKLVVAGMLHLGVVLGQHARTSSQTPVGGSLPNSAERTEIARQHYAKNVEEADKLLQLAAELKTDLDQQTGSLISAKTVKDAQEIKKLANSIAKRLKSD